MRTRDSNANVLSEVLEFLHPALRGELNQLVDPNLFEYLRRLHKTYSGDGSKAIEIAVQQTYRIQMTKRYTWALGTI